MYKRQAACSRKSPASWIACGRIHAQIWELLIAMMAMEAMFGVPGLVAAPIYYAYVKSELIAARLL